MKKIYTLILTVLISFFAHAQIPNAGFESWSGGLPLEWSCGASASNIYVTQDNNAHSGNFAARLHTVPGAPHATSASLFPKAVNGTLWFFVNTPVRPNFIEFWAITNLDSGDVLSFTTALKQGSNVIGVVNGVCVSTNSSTYQFYSFPINYSTNGTPDSGNVTFKFYTGGCSTFNSFVHDSTYAIIDDLGFDGATGIETGNQSMVTNAVYPNPASTISYLNYDAEETTSINIQLVDMLGKGVKHVGKFNQSPGNHTYAFDVSELPPGIYFYKLESDAGISYKKLIVGR